MFVTTWAVYLECFIFFIIFIIYKLRRGWITMNTTIFKKSSLLHIFKFLLVFACLFALISVLFGSFRNYGYTYSSVIAKERQIEAEPPFSLDVIFLGDSLTQAAISPALIEQETQIKSFNASAGGQWVGDAYAILKQAYKTQAPRIVVIEANTFYRDLDDLQLWQIEYMPLLSYHLVPVILLEEKPQINKSKGFSSSEEIKPFEPFTDYMNSETEKHDFPLQIKNELAKIKNLCRQNNTELIIITVPAAKTTIDSVLTSWTVGKHLAVQEWCDQNDITYIDYNCLLNDIGFDWNTDSRDGGDHVNNSGAYKITSHLAKKLQALLNDDAAKEGH